MSIVGIDFGTTNSIVALAGDDGAELLKDASNRALLPTVVFLPRGKEPIVGIAARNRLNLSPERCFAGIKRLLGLKHQSSPSRQLEKLFGWRLERGPDNAAALSVDGQLWTAVDLSAEVFKSLHRIASARLSTPTVRAIITVPAGFTYAQRTALIQAAERGGIEVEQLMNEPTAAAIAYGLTSEKQRKIAVFDLGGGTFDFTVLEVHDANFDVLSTTADPMLGSSDIDGAIADYIADMLRKEHGLVVQRDRMNRLLPAAERMKIELSTKDITHASIAARWIGLPGQGVYQVSLTRQTLEGLARPLIAKCMSCVRKGLESAELGIHDLDEIILVGGGSLMPLVQELNTDFFGRTPLHDIDPEEVVAIGAALWAQQLERPKTQRPSDHTTQSTLHDRTAIGLGIGTIAGIVDYIIPANARVPAQGIRHFTTSHDGQQDIRLQIYQGTSRHIEDCQLLGEISLDNLPVVARGGSCVAVTFILDTNGLVLISAVDKTNGIAHETQLQSVLSFVEQPES